LEGWRVGKLEGWKVVPRASLWEKVGRLHLLIKRKAPTNVGAFL